MTEQEVYLSGALVTRYTTTNVLELGIQKQEGRVSALGYFYPSGACTSQIREGVDSFSEYLDALEVANLARRKKLTSLNRQLERSRKKLASLERQIEQARTIIFECDDDFST